jgi:hypothetical protein
VVEVGRCTLADAVPVLSGGTALRVGFGTPSGLCGASQVDDSIPDIATHPSVSQYRPLGRLTSFQRLEIKDVPDSKPVALLS